MDFIPTIPPSLPPAAIRLAESELAHINASLARRVEEHKARFAAFWDAEATPDELLEAMGSRASLYLAAAGESVEHIGRLAAIAGKSTSDYMPAEDCVPRRAFVLHEDGTVTLEPPADGHDAHGRPLPVVEPVVEDEEPA